MLVCGFRALDGGISPFLSCAHCFRVIRATASGEFDSLKSLSQPFQILPQRPAKNLACIDGFPHPFGSCRVVCLACTELLSKVATFFRSPGDFPDRIHSMALIARSPENAVGPCALALWKTFVRSIYVARYTSSKSIIHVIPILQPARHMYSHPTCNLNLYHKKHKDNTHYQHHTLRLNKLLRSI